MRGMMMIVMLIRIVILLGIMIEITNRLKIGWILDFQRKQIFLIKKIIYLIKVSKIKKLRLLLQGCGCINPILKLHLVKKYMNILHVNQGHFFQGTTVCFRIHQIDLSDNFMRY